MFIRVLVLLFGLLLLVHFTNAYAEPIYEASVQGIRIVVYKEKCKLEAITNLPWRAVWFQNGQETEGCIGAKDDLGVVVGYFADKTIVVLPTDLFRRLTGA